MRRLNSNFVESVQKVVIEEKLETNYFDLIEENISKYKINEIIGNNDLLNDCYDLFEKELPFIKEYYIHNNYPINPGKIIDENEVLTTAKFISLLNEHMYNSSNLVSLLPSLITYKFLRIDYTNSIKIENFNEVALSNIKNEISTILAALKSAISTDQARYFEKHITEMYKTGSENGDVKSIYEFIEAVERGIGFHSPTSFYEIVKFIRFIDNEVFIQNLNNKQQVVEIIFLLDGLDLIEKIDLLMDSNINNKWCLYELFRQIIKDTEERRMSDSFHKDMSNLLSKIAFIDTSLFRNLIISNKFDDNFTIILAYSLSKLEKKFLDIYLDTVHLDTHNHNIERNHLFINALINSDSEENTLYLCNEIYYKWQSLLENIYNEGQFLNDIVYSDYYYCVLHYLIVEYDEQRLVQEIELTLKYIEDTEHSWKVNSIGEISHYFIGLTKLYTFSIIFKEKSLNWNDKDNLYELILKFLQDRKRWLRFFRIIEIPNINKEIMKNFK